MKSTLISALSFIGAAYGHGILTDISIDNTKYKMFDPYSTPFQQPVPSVVGWTVDNNGPIEDLNSPSIACHIDAKPPPIAAKAAAGSEVTFHWNDWPDSHRGPVINYLAKCPGDCKDANVNQLDFFKFDEAGLLPDGTWVSDTIIQQGFTWKARIPSDIAPGNYVLRHELVALHSAYNPNGAQFYPACANLEITGSGTAVPTDTVRFPGAYNAEDPGVFFNIYFPTPTSYPIPGPKVYKAGAAPAASTSGSVEPAPTSSTPAATPSSSPAPVEEEEEPEKPAPQPVKAVTPAPGEPTSEEDPTPAEPTPAEPTPAKPTPAKPTPAEPIPDYEEGAEEDTTAGEAPGAPSSPAVEVPKPPVVVVGSPPFAATGTAPVVQPLPQQTNQPPVENTVAVSSTSSMGADGTMTMTSAITSTVISTSTCTSTIVQTVKFTLTAQPDAAIPAPTKTVYIVRPSSGAQLDDNKPAPPAQPAPAPAAPECTCPPVHRYRYRSLW